MTKNDKFTGRQHITYSKNEGAIGEFKNGDLINGYYKLLDKEDDAYIVEMKDGEIFSRVDSSGGYIFEIRNKKQFNELINSKIYKVIEISFHKTSYPSIFNSSFSQLSNYYFCHLIFLELLPTPKYNKYFLALIENFEKGDHFKSNFALMPNLSFKEVKLSDYKGKKVVLFFYPLDFTFV